MEQVVVTAFEKWFSKKYASEIRRGRMGRFGYHLQLDKTKDGHHYVSEVTQDKFETWCDAYKEFSGA